MDNILQEVKNERLRQDAKWGQQNHISKCKYFTNVDYGICSETTAKISCESAFENNIGSWAHIFIEEVAELINAGDIVKLREELIQTIAVGVAWVESIDRNGN